MKNLCNRKIKLKDVMMNFFNFSEKERINKNSFSYNKMSRKNFSDNSKLEEFKINFDKNTSYEEFKNQVDKNIEILNSEELRVNSSKLMEMLNTDGLDKTKEEIEVISKLVDNQGKENVKKIIK
jgi:hypothetical protein